MEYNYSLNENQFILIEKFFDDIIIALQTILVATEDISDVTKKLAVQTLIYDRLNNVAQQKQSLYNLAKYPILPHITGMFINHD